MPPQIPSPIIAGGGQRRGLGEILLASVLRQLVGTGLQAGLSQMPGIEPETPASPEETFAQEQLRISGRGAESNVLRQASPFQPGGSTREEQAQAAQRVEDLRSTAPERFSLLQELRQQEQERREGEEARKRIEATVTSVLSGIDVPEGQEEPIRSLLTFKALNPDALPAETFNRLASLVGLPETEAERIDLELAKSRKDEIIARTRKIRQDLAKEARRESAIRELVELYDLPGPVANATDLAEELIKSRTRSFNEIREDITVRLLTTVRTDLFGNPVGFVTSDEALAAADRVARQLDPEGATEAEDLDPEFVQAAEFVADMRPLIQEKLREGSTPAEIKKNFLILAEDRGFDSKEANRIFTELIRTLSTVQ